MSNQTTSITAAVGIPLSIPNSYRLTIRGLEHRCYRCHEWKIATTAEFVTERKAKMGLGGLCLSCNRQRARDWRRKNPAKACATRLRRYARDQRAAGTLTAIDREQLFDLYGHHCLACSRHESVCGKLIADHVIPPPAGSHDVSNRQPLCKECNLRKGASSIDYRPTWERARMAANELAA